MALQIFTDLSAQYDPAIATGVNAVIQQGIAGNAENIAEALVVYVIIVGGMMACREMRMAAFVKHMLRAGIISMLMTVAGFNQFIAQPALNTIPDWIAQTVNNNTGVTAGPQQFDLLKSAADHQTAAIYQQATGWSNLGYRLEAALVNGMIGFVLLVQYGIWEFSRGIMGLLVATVPFVLFFALFEATRSIVTRLFDKMAGILILQLMLAILLQITLAADMHIMVQQSQASAAGTAGLDSMLGALWGILLVFTFGLGMVLFIPSVAAYVGGGIALNISSNMAGLAGAGIGAVRGGAGVAARMGGRAVNAARRKLA